MNSANAKAFSAFCIANKANFFIDAEMERLSLRAIQWLCTITTSIFAYVKPENRQQFFGVCLGILLARSLNEMMIVIMNGKSVRNLLKFCFMLLFWNKFCTNSLHFFIVAFSFIISNVRNSYNQMLLKWLQNCVFKIAFVEAILTYVLPSLSVFKTEVKYYYRNFQCFWCSYFISLRGVCAQFLKQIWITLTLFQ